MHLVTVRKWIGIELIEVSFVEKLVSILGGGLSILLLIGLSHWEIPNAIHQLGFRVVLIPALANALVMVVLALILNSAFKWRRYPASFNPKPLSSLQTVTVTPTHEEIMAAVRSFDSFVDSRRQIFCA